MIQCDVDPRRVLVQYFLVLLLLLTDTSVVRAIDGGGDSGYTGPEDTLSITALINGEYVIRTRNEICYRFTPNTNFDFSSLRELKWVLVRDKEVFRTVDCQNCCASIDTIEHVISVFPEYEFDLWVREKSGQAMMNFVPSLDLAIIFPKPEMFSEKLNSRLEHQDSLILVLREATDVLSGGIGTFNRLINLLGTILHWIVYGGIAVLLIDWVRKKKRATQRTVDIQSETEGNY